MTLPVPPETVKKRRGTREVNAKIITDRKVCNACTESYSSLLFLRVKGILFFDDVLYLIFFTLKNTKFILMSLVGGSNPDSLKIKITKKIRKSTIKKIQKIQKTSKLMLT